VARALVGTCRSDCNLQGLFLWHGLLMPASLTSLWMWCLSSPWSSLTHSLVCFIQCYSFLGQRFHCLTLSQPATYIHAAADFLDGAETGGRIQPHPRSLSVSGWRDFCGIVSVWTACDSLLGLSMLLSGMAPHSPIATSKPIEHWWNPNHCLQL
jgi:hypothetical protein